ncbi:MAG TPA: carboxypeptidase-like regulatory domain-containing protein, partial [Terriglobales bacterium]|nr:carboxypeptidase-like regulatory domain-containing protein [Terriglobales bacterium]
RWFKFKGAYVIANRNFERVGVSSQSSTENDKENLEIQFRPSESLNFSAARFNLVPAPTKDQAGDAAVVNQFTVSARKAGFQFVGSSFSSQTGLANAQGWSASAGRTIGDRLQASTSFFRNTSNRGPPSSSWEQSLREIFSPRFNLLGILTHSDGGTSLSWGGSFLSNPIAVDVEYQTVYSPFNPLKPFHQVLLLNVRLQPLGSLILNAASFVTPEGAVKYTTYGSAWLQHGDASPLLSNKFKLNKFIVSGRVVDQAGNPVEGAALSVNDELVFSDATGGFFLRVKKHKSYQFAVLPDDFMCPGKFQITSAPSRVIPSSSESESSGINVVLRLDPSKGRSP